MLKENIFGMCVDHVFELFVGKVCAQGVFGMSCRDAEHFEFLDEFVFVCFAQRVVHASLQSGEYLVELPEVGCGVLLDDIFDIAQKEITTLQQGSYWEHCGVRQCVGEWSNPWDDGWRSKQPFVHEKLRMEHPKDITLSVPAGASCLGDKILEPVHIRLLEGVSEVDDWEPMVVVEEAFGT